MNPKTRSQIFLALAILVFVVIPFLFWRGTWFGTELTASQMRQYLADRERPRRVQHALAQIEKKMAAADPGARIWYPEVVQLSTHPAWEVRITAAWVMGQDNSYPPFHRALQHMISDPDAMVRRNAALALVRFRDASGKGEILSMLRPCAVRSNAGGRISLWVSLGQRCQHGSILAKISDNQTSRDLPAPISGTVEVISARSGDSVSAGQLVLTLSADENQLWEALRALYLIGDGGDAGEIAKFTKPPYPERIRRQALETAGRIGQQTR